MCKPKCRRADGQTDAQTRALAKGPLRGTNKIAQGQCEPSGPIIVYVRYAYSPKIQLSSLTTVQAIKHETKVATSIDSNKILSGNMYTIAERVKVSF